MPTLPLPMWKFTPRPSGESADAGHTNWSFRDAGEGAFRVVFPEGGAADADASADAAYLFVADGSRLYRVDAEMARALDGAPVGLTGEQARALLAAALGVPVQRPVTDAAPEAVPLRSLSLAVAQRCNLACTYCFAQEGGFGREASSMSPDTARAAVDRLLDGAAPGENVRISFMGGEPLANRPVLQETTWYARRQAEARGLSVGFGVTTNGTLLTEADVAFFAAERFTVTVSIDGVGAAHDGLRPFKGGGGSFDRVVGRVRPLLAAAASGDGHLEVSARVTVTPRNLRLRETLEALAALGFRSVGFSPMLSSPTGRDQMDGEGLREMLAQMIDCGRACERRLTAGGEYPFANLLTAVQEIHRGTHRPYPCGAGGGYMGVSAEGGLFACHRFVNDEAGRMGDLAGGVDATRQRAWLDSRHVHRQEPCRTCWARYLCGGGCHHEVLHRGRPSCEYIRGWLEFCLGAYVRLSAARPDLFPGAKAHGGEAPG